MLLQIPFPSEKRAEIKPKKGFLPLQLNKTHKIQSLVSNKQASVERPAGALFQTMDVTDKRRRASQGREASGQLAEGRDGDRERRRRGEEDRGQTTEGRESRCRKYISDFEFRI